MNIVITFTEQRDREDGKAQCSIAAELDTLLEGEPSLEAVIKRLRAERGLVGHTCRNGSLELGDAVQAQSSLDAI